VVVDVVASPSPSAAGDGATTPHPLPSDAYFPGLYAGELPDPCWSADGAFLWLTSQFGARDVVLRVHVATGTVVRERAATSVLQGAGAAAAGAAPALDASARVLAVIPRSVTPGAPSSTAGVMMLVAACTPVHPDRVGVLTLADTNAACSMAPVVAGDETTLAGSINDVTDAALLGVEPVDTSAPGAAAAHWTWSVLPTPCHPPNAALAAPFGEAAADAEDDADVDVDAGADADEEGSSAGAAACGAAPSLSAALRGVSLALAEVQWRVVPVHPRDGSGHVFEAIVLLPSAKAGSGASPCTSARAFELGGAGGAAGSAGHPTATTSMGAGTAAASPGAPLIVVPHGGPHSAFSTMFLHAYAWLATLGYGVVLVNFRGSLGYGDHITATLPGRCGSQDVADVHDATLTVLAMAGCAAAAAEAAAAGVRVDAAAPSLGVAFDGGRVGVVGGSHGGFLAGHLIAAFPRWYRAAAMRNPVTNIASMVTITDIPDWCYTEVAGVGAFDFGTYPCPTPELLARMYAASPLSRLATVRAPVLLLVGAKDRRVPGAQAVEYYHAYKAALQARASGEAAASSATATGADAAQAASASVRDRVRLLVYPEDVHAIDKPASEADAWVNIALWMGKHLGV
jgi:hypothetical protein